MKILGINYGHNASIGLLENGKVVFCQNEERLNNMKNSAGFPVKTLEYIYQKYGRDIDLVVFPGEKLFGYLFLKETGFESKRYLDYFKKTRPRDISFLLRYFFSKYFTNFMANLWRWRIRRFENKLENNTSLRREAKEYFSKAVGLPQEKLIFLDHHTAHAYSVGFSVDNNKKTLVFTLDGEGDDLCGSVGIYEKGKLEIISRIPRLNSLGGLYIEVTGFLGMKPNEDEYKVMGLAPYAKLDSSPVREVKEKFKELIFLNDKLEFESRVPSPMFRYFLFDNLGYERFDNLAGGLQVFLEEIVTQWVSEWIKKTGIKDVALSGGVFMNVKLNQRIAELDEVETIFPMPSAGDESLVFGCMLYGYKKYCDEKNIPFEPKPLTDLYLGNGFSDKEIEDYFKNNPLGEKYSVSHFDDIDAEVAKLLAENKIVARCTGRMEWGARALGNRSILANPSSKDSVMIINEMIKNRDFWMPFASSILEEDFLRYIENPKGIFAPYMNLTFNSTDIAKKEIIAGLHNYDFTGRPQCVRKSWNPSYHNLISEFKKRTGIGGVLNTSFNLHGEPVAYGPKEAMHVLSNSGLEYLAIGNYLVKKADGR